MKRKFYYVFYKRKKYVTFNIKCENANGYAQLERACLCTDQTEPLSTQ